MLSIVWMACVNKNNPERRKKQVGQERRRNGEYHDEKRADGRGASESIDAEGGGIRERQEEGKGLKQCDLLYVAVIDSTSPLKRHEVQH